MRSNGRAFQQVLRSGTSIGANYREAYRGRSKPEFIAKCGDCLREVEETAYWLELLVEAKIVPESKLEPLRQECRELTAIFVTILKRSKGSDFFLSSSFCLFLESLVSSSFLPPFSFFLLSFFSPSVLPPFFALRSQFSVERWTFAFCLFLFCGSGLLSPREFARKPS